MDNRKISKTAIIIGGGLVGSLCACFLAKRNYKIVIYDFRDDIRNGMTVKGRSINLALSNRGRKALRFIGLEEKILKKAIPMKGRLIHSIHGDVNSIPYDIHTNQCIYSIDRNYLNQLLVKESSENFPNVKYHFKYKLINVNFNEGSVTLHNLENNMEYKDTADLIIGADGAYSTLRRFIQHTPLFDLNQTYIPHGYLELSIPKENGNKMISNHLHIWPRGEFMMIALPNFDNSWTVTLFMPFEYFDNLDNEKKLLDFFKDTFPDSIDLIGENCLIETFNKSKPSPLISIKCKPYYYGDRFLLIGDAAHAMVPFYGQGMNAGFEDCLIFERILNDTGNNIPIAIKEFSKERVENTQAICDLAMYNYSEMRDLVTKRSYHMRKWFDNLMFKYFKNKWVPLYNSVTFSHLGYKECIDNRKWQNKKLLIKVITLIVIDNGNKIYLQYKTI